MIKEVLSDCENRMKKALAFTREEFSNIRTGRANTSMFDSIQVDYYGAPTPLQQLASFNIPEARTVIVNPFDKGAMDAIIKAIRESDLGVNPTDDGKIIRVTLPALTEERRKEYVKLAKTKAEEGRIAVRGIRRKGMDQLDEIKKDGDAGEDDVERAQKDLEGLTKTSVEKVDKVMEAKEEELLTI